MSVIFGVVAFIMFTLILLLFPSRISLKGKLLLLVLIIIISMVASMANTFLPLWQTILMIFLLTFLFTYLLSKRRDSLYFQQDNDKNNKIEQEEKRLSIPVRIIGTTVYNPEIDTNEVQHIKESQEDEYINTEEMSNIVPLEYKEVDNLEDINEKALRKGMFQQEIDTDLDVLLNRSTLEDEMESFLEKNEEEDSVVINRNLELLLDQIEGQEATNNIESKRVEQISKLVELEDNVIEEIQLRPITKVENNKEELQFTPFELIDEINEFKKEEK